mmetsp:Transcript_48447/g.71800  ORF Transcript_48447/g.71800 Transcript_48447/m.71800 type:complete len:452 (+) Transcript_48447:64-1419(+)|eukprot:CAMPEP_0195506590 /NCGR_PEP_ID=MMETSP0794_2-20130614/170_1 /TAXON_ID=515487 /ORGANISM="Stephanopyxis turris, Strain CCMP 815" /LENGTH=451 /DNA_ID=CAMNT_0040632945 /DNA_START=64 /DNA_END=1419 /DNA_ORIENTATION=+
MWRRKQSEPENGPLGPHQLPHSPLRPTKTETTAAEGATECEKIKADETTTTKIFDKHDSSFEEAELQGATRVDDDDDKFQPGDHIYVMERFSQRHGIVFEVNADDNGNEEEHVNVVSFYHNARNTRHKNNDNSPTSETKSSSEETLLLVYSETLSQFAAGNEVRKVRYSCGVARRILSRGGTATCVCPDEAGLVVSRVRFLIENPRVLPEHGRLSANDECVAVWCRTGRFCTLQGASILELTSMSHGVSSAMLGAVVTQVTAVSKVSLSYMGTSWMLAVPVATAYPYLLPLFVGYKLTGLVPLEIMRRNKNKWRVISERMNKDFWARAQEEVKVEYFGRCIASDQGFVRKFFGGQQTEDDNAGHYMPVDMGDGNDDDDAASDQEMEERVQRHFGTTGGQCHDLDNTAESSREDRDETEEKPTKGNIVQKWTKRLSLRSLNLNGLVRQTKDT